MTEKVSMLHYQRAINNFEKFTNSKMIVEEDSGIKYEIDKENHHAKVIGCFDDIEDIFIPRFIKHDSQEYPIKITSTKTFDSISIRTVNFPEDSEVQTIKSDIFGTSPNIPVFLLNLKMGGVKIQENVL